MEGLRVQFRIQGRFLTRHLLRANLAVYGLQSFAKALAFRVLEFPYSLHCKPETLINSLPYGSMYPNSVYICIHTHTLALK